MLTVDQIDALLQPLDKARVKAKQGQSHLEAWDVRRHLLRVFGWGGWSFDVVSCECILERSVWDSEKATETHKGRHTVAYRVIGRLTIFDPETHDVLATFEDGATGDAQNQPGFAAAHDMALKTAMSQAIKRCAINLGDRFGLSLYNKGTTGAVVGKSLPHKATTEHDAVEAVTGGELDEPEPEEPGEEPTVPAFLEFFNGLDGGAKNTVLRWLRDKGLRPPTAPDDLVTEARALLAGVEVGPPKDRGEGVEGGGTTAPVAPPSSRLARAEQAAGENGTSLSKAAEIAASHARAGADEKLKAAGG